MLYVFLVDTGEMLTYDMNLAMESVSKLQTVIAETYNIAVDKQVLLISGGENLHPESRVCSYSAGTDTNPIFLFSKSTIEAAHPPSPSVNYGSDADLKEQVEGSLNMPSSYETVVARAQLALQFHDVAKEEMRVCEHLVHDQHLQHQGWAAAIANLEDITSAFKNRAEIFEQNFLDFLSKRDSSVEILSKFSDIVSLLAKIPLLPCLVPERLRELQRDTESQPIEEETAAKNTTESGEMITLLEWISAQDQRSSLEQMAQQCKQGMEQFDESVKTGLLEEVNKIIDAINNPSMKEVKGLEDRLYGLEQLMFGAGRILQEQADMAQGFVQNQTRASNLRDPSVLPDLCASHKRQLLVMLKNQQNLRDIRRRCMRAKEELSVNLHTRLRWVMYVEKNICDVDGKLVIYHENLKKLRRKLEIIQQMHDAPDVYASAIIEVIRRKEFSEHFRRWAGSLSEESSRLHSEEVSRREKFYTYLKHHFLQVLFPGFEDKPPLFASESPAAFDTKLPHVTAQDVDLLRSHVPEFIEKLRVQDVPSLIDQLSAATLKAMSSARDAFTFTHLTQGSALFDKDQFTSDIIVIQNNGSNGIQQVSEKPELLFSQQQQEIVTRFLSATDQRATVDLLQDQHVSQSVEVLDASEITEEGMAEISGGKATGETEGTSPQQQDDAVLKGLTEKAPMSSSSPDVEEPISQDFMTADFFIDESMPSSMTESPSNRRLLELQQSLQEKSTQVDSLAKELETCRTQLDKETEKTKSLYEMTQTGMSSIRGDMSNLISSFTSDRNDMLECIQSVRQNSVDLVSRYCQKAEAHHEKVLTDLKDHHASAVKEFENKFEVEKQKLIDAHQEVNIYQQKIMETDNQYESLKEEMSVKVNELENRIETEKSEITKRLTLEHEIELDKVRSDFIRDLEEKDSEIQSLNKNLQDSVDNIAKLSKEKDTIVNTLTAEFQEEKEKEIEILKQKHSEAVEQELTLVKKELIKSHDEHISQLKTEFAEKLQAALKQQQCDLTEEHKRTVENLSVSLKQSHDEEVQSLQKKHSESLESEIAALKVTLSQEYQEQLKQVKKEVALEKKKLADKEASQSTQMVTEATHKQILEDIKQRHELDKQSSLNQVVQDLRTQHQAELDELMEKFEKDRSDSLSALKASLTAEKQVLFNEAVQKVTIEKDRIIEIMKQREAELLSKQQQDRALIEKLSAGRSKEELVQIEQLEEKRGATALESSDMMYQSAMGSSIVPMTESPGHIHDRISYLEHELKSKQEELGKLHSHIMELSMTKSTKSMVQQDKVSITTCNAGDIVLLCLDERHDHYVVFTVGSTLHFLHSECLETLGLKTEMGEPRRSWVLAEITDKEYCQAKKANNRFKVPVGTRFYRVKAKPWNREAALQREGTTSQK